MMSRPDELPWVSLVTPAYNQAEYLGDTIESVLAQDYPRLEYIVLDDGSSDDTPQVLERYGDRVRHERHANMGQARTLNRGWSLAKGSLLGYLSSDDRLEPEAISQLVQALTLHPDSAVAYGDFELIDARGRSLRLVRTEEFDLERLTVDLVCQPGPGALFRRTVFDRAGGWKPHLRQVPDFDFWLRASKHGSFVRVPEVLAQYRIHDGSASFRVTPPERSMEIVEVVRSHWLGSDGPQPQRAISVAHLIAAKSHAQSGRLDSSFRQWLRAVALHPGKLWSVSAWRMMLSGLTRRAAYRLWGRGR